MNHPTACKAEGRRLAPNQRYAEGGGPLARGRGGNGRHGGFGSHWGEPVKLRRPVPVQVPTVRTKIV